MFRKVLISSVFAFLSGLFPGLVSGSNYNSCTNPEVFFSRLSAEVSGCPYLPDSTLLKDTIICAGSTVTLVAPTLFSSVVDLEDFENPVSNGWSDTVRFPFNSSMVSGPYGNQQVSWFLNNLPAHDSIALTFDLYIHDSWQGYPVFGPDFYYQIIDSDTLLTTTFDNTSIGYQAFPDPYPAVHSPGTGSMATLPYRCIVGDVTRLYQLSFKKAHTSQTINVGFAGAPDQNLCDESWSFDNVKLSLIHMPGVLKYLWSTNDTTSTIAVSPSMTTTYTVIVSNGIDTLYDTCTVYVAQADAGLNDTICFGDSTQLLTSAGAQSYLWAPASGLSSVIVSNPVANPTSSTIYYLTTVWNMSTFQKTCTDSVKITVIPLPQVSLGNDITQCQGTNAFLDPGVGYATFLWSTSSTTPTLWVMQSGTYWVEVTNQYGCMARDSILVTFNPNPVVSLIPSADTICQGKPATIRAVSNLSPSLFVWSTGSLADSIVVAPLSTSTYKVTVTHQGCAATDSVVIHTKHQPEPYCFATKYSMCNGDSTTIQVVSLFAASTVYQWSTGQFGQTIHVTPLTTTSYTVTATLNGCAGDTTIQIDVKSIPQISMVASPPSVCLGDTTKLTALSNIWGTTFNWSTGHTGSQILLKPSLTAQVKVTGTVNGCSSSDSLMISVKPVPSVQVAVSQNPVCAGDTVFFSASSNMPNANFIWSTAAFTPQISVTPSFTATYTVTATVSGCYSDTTIVISVNPSPQLTVTPMPVELCNGESVIIDVSSDMTNTQFSWSNGMTGTPISISPSASFTLLLSATASNCTSVLEIPVDVTPMPEVSLGKDGYVCEGEPVLLVPTGAFQTLRWWDGGTAPQVFIYDPGYYWVKAMNGQCELIDSVFFDECPSINVPNIFTPNGDGYNDFFEIPYSSIEIRSVQIYNRWGRVVFFSEDDTDFWDGASNGQPCADGAYFYVIRYFNPKFNLVQEKAGSVQLLR
jgi:gliding motility-associated-like protein